MYAGLHFFPRFSAGIFINYSSSCKDRHPSLAERRRYKRTTRPSSAARHFNLKRNSGVVVPRPSASGSVTKIALDGPLSLSLSLAPSQRNLFHGSVSTNSGSNTSQDIPFPAYLVNHDPWYVPYPSEMRHRTLKPTSGDPGMLLNWERLLTRWGSCYLWIKPSGVTHQLFQRGVNVDRTWDVPGSVIFKPNSRKPFNVLFPFLPLFRFDACWVEKLLSNSIFAMFWQLSGFLTKMRGLHSILPYFENVNFSTELSWFWRIWKLHWSKMPINQCQVITF